MQRRNELLGGCHGQMELLFIILWTRQKQREFNHLLYSEKRKKIFGMMLNPQHDYTTNTA